MISVASRTVAGLAIDEYVSGDVEDGALPIVIAMHGRGGLPTLPFGSSRLPCRLLVARGPVALGDGFAWSSHYARESRHEALARDIAESADRLRVVVESVADERGAAGRAIAIGFSQGAMVALALATRHEGLVRDVVVGAAWIPPPLEPERSAPGLRIRMAHGEADQVVPFEWGRAQALRLKGRGLDVELRSFPGVAHVESSEMAACLTAWREAAIARAWGAPEPAVPELGRRVEEVTPKLGRWERLRAKGRKLFSQRS